MKFDTSNFEESSRSKIHVKRDEFSVSQISEVIFNWMDLCRSHCGQLAAHFDNGTFGDTSLGTVGKTVTKVTTKRRTKRETRISCDVH